MPEHAMTVTPVVVAESEDGQHQQIDFSVVSNEGRAAVTAENNQLDIDSDFADYVWDESTKSYRHAFADADFEHYSEDEFVEELNSQDFFDQAEITNEDFNYLQDSVGGQETYMQMMQWSQHHLSEQTIDAFDSIMATKDTEEMHAAIQDLYQLYVENDGEEWYADNFTTEWVEEDDEYYEDDEYEEDSYELDSDEISDLMDIAGGPENYQMLLQFAAENLPEEFISQYDEIMASGNVQDIEESIGVLIDLYNEQFEDDDGYAHDSDYDTDTGAVNSYY